MSSAIRHARRRSDEKAADVGDRRLDTVLVGQSGGFPKFPPRITEPTTDEAATVEASRGSANAGGRASAGS